MSRQYRKLIERQEKETLFSKAALSQDHSRHEGAEDDHRLPYKRDVDRILHSKAYARYADKTQVVYLVANDHITHRSLHVQLVSSFARGIAEILRLNVDLVEAIALAHDVGHPPFGHEGEGYLSQLSEEYGNGPFTHPWQSCRLLTDIEPLNLGLAVYDGILCHDGGMKEYTMTPRYGKSWDDYFVDLETKKANSDANLTPGTLEGCLVKLCDTMSYIGKDVEDAISLGILSRHDVPKTCLGTTNREILSVLAADIIQQSFEKDTLSLSEENYEALKTLRSFNFERIYSNPKLKVESKKIRRSYRILFDILLTDYEQNGGDSHLARHYLQNKSRHYLEKTSPVQKVIDYIAGMTDSFFIRTLEQLIIPKQIELD